MDGISQSLGGRNEKIQTVSMHTASIRLHLWTFLENFGCLRGTNVPCFAKLILKY